MDYSKIPEGADYQTIHKYLVAFMNEKEEIEKKYSLIYALEQLSIIAEQHSYYSVDRSMEIQLSDYLINVINMKNYEIMDIVLFIVVNMSLKRVMDFLLKNIEEASSEVKEMIVESYEEM